MDSRTRAGGSGDAERPDHRPQEPYELPAEGEPFDLPDEPAEYDLVLLNDDAHTFEYVIALLHDLCGVPRDDGYGMTETIDYRGERVVFRGSWQEVVQKRDEVIAYGPDPRLPNSTGPLGVEIRESSSG
jgi:ATP-dependent Clp protease adaptor protein ClpS